MATVASSSYSTEFNYPHTNPNSSGEALSPSTTSSTTHSMSLPPPPPLETFGYPHQHDYFHEEDREEEDDDGRRHRSSEDVDFDSSEHADPLLQRRENPSQSEFKHFADMAVVFQGSGAVVHPDNFAELSSKLPSNYEQPSTSSSSIVLESGYNDHCDRVHHSSSSGNSLAFSPEGYRQGNNGGSRSNDHYAMDCRQSINIVPFQGVIF